MRRVGVEEAAAVGAHFFDDLLRGDRPLGNDLSRTIQGVHDGIRVEVLDDSLRDQHKCAHNRDGQQEVEHTASQVDPEVAHVLRAAAGESTYQRDRQRDTGGGRDKVVKRQPCHLRQVGHGLLAGVVLPVGVGREAGGGIEREPWLDIAKTLGVEESRLPLLGALEQIQEQHAGHAEDQHGDDVLPPLLLILRMNAAQPVK